MNDGRPIGRDPPLGLTHQPMSRFVPRPSFLTSVGGQSEPSVRWEGTNRVRWPVSKKPMSSKPILTFDVGLTSRKTAWGRGGVVDTGL